MSVSEERATAPTPTPPPKNDSNNNNDDDDDNNNNKNNNNNSRQNRKPKANIFHSSDRLKCFTQSLEVSRSRPYNLHEK